MQADINPNHEMNEQIRNEYLLSEYWFKYPPINAADTLPVLYQLQLQVYRS